MRSIVVAYRTALLLSIFAAAEPALAADFILATGRRDPRIYAIDLGRVQTPNNNTPNAIISRSKVRSGRLDGMTGGDPANIVLSQDGKTAYVMNHHGQVSNSEFLQHGGRASVSIMDVKKMLQKSVRQFRGGGRESHRRRLVRRRRRAAAQQPQSPAHQRSEGWLSEDGSNRITIIDPKTGVVVGQIQMAMKGSGHKQLRPDCPDVDVPFKGGPPPTNVYLAPSKQFGCWPDPESLAVGKGSDGKPYLFSGNAGTEDVSVIDLGRRAQGRGGGRGRAAHSGTNRSVRHRGEPERQVDRGHRARDQSGGRQRRQHHLDHRRRSRPRGQAGRRSRPRAGRHR